MKNFIILFLIFCLLSCSQKTEEIVSEVKGDNIEEQMIQAYSEGKLALEKGDVLYAAKKFNEAELLYPQSDWAPKSSLMAAYAYWSQGYYSNSIKELKRFINIYPKNPNLDYAYYLLAINYYDSIVDEKKDLRPLIESKKYFNIILNNYPDTDFALDSQFKLDLIQDILAAKEMYISRHYIKKQKWIAAINRLKTIIVDYDETIYVEEALHRLVEVYYIIGLEGEAKKYAVLLGYNYKSSEWYDKSYKIFNKDYSNIKKKKKIKKNKKLLEKIKSLF